MMDQTHLGYAYWQQPMANRYAFSQQLATPVANIPPSLPYVTAVQPKKQALAGAMRLLVEGSMGAWYARRLTSFGIAA